MDARPLIPPPTSVSELVGSEASELALEVDASETSIGVRGARKGAHPGLSFTSAFPPHASREGDLEAP
jgi:hypothetical protein